MCRFIHTYTHAYTYWFMHTCLHTCIHALTHACLHGIRSSVIFQFTIRDVRWKLIFRNFRWMETKLRVELKAWLLKCVICEIKYCIPRSSQDQLPLTVNPRITYRAKGCQNEAFAPWVFVLWFHHCNKVTWELHPLFLEIRKEQKYD